MDRPTRTASIRTHGWTTRSTFSHVTWQRHGGRAEEMAHALGGDAVHVFPSHLSARRWVLLRYTVSVLMTAVALLRRRPRAVAVTNPPVVPGLVVAAYARLSGAPFLLDSHTSSFGVKGNEMARRSLGVTRWLARRSAGVMVTTSSWVAEVQRWGARGLVVHEAPPAWTVPAPTPAARPRVLFVGVFSDDEPVAEVVQAASDLPDVDLLVTGDLARAPEGLLASAGDNVTFLGFLDQTAYRRELQDCDIVVALTTEPTSVMRAAYEAVYAGRGLVVSDWPTLREVFPLARHRANHATALADGIRAALADDDDARLHRSRQARDLQLQRWSQQLHSMREALAIA